MFGLPSPVDSTPKAKRVQIYWTQPMEDLVRRIVAQHPEMTRQEQADEFNKLNGGNPPISFTAFTGKIQSLGLRNRKRGGYGLAAPAAPVVQANPPTPSSQGAGQNMVRALLLEDGDKKPEVGRVAAQPWTASYHPRLAAQLPSPAGPSVDLTADSDEDGHQPAYSHLPRAATKSDADSAFDATTFAAPSDHSSPLPSPAPDARRANPEAHSAEAQLEDLVAKRVRAAEAVEEGLTELIELKRRRLAKARGQT